MNEIVLRNQVPLRYDAQFSYYEDRLHLWNYDLRIILLQFVAKPVIDTVTIMAMRDEANAINLNIYAYVFPSYCDRRNCTEWP